jgi:drug/metabolite transporter (DMT)-like permease
LILLVFFNCNKKWIIFNQKNINKKLTGIISTHEESESLSIFHYCNCHYGHLNGICIHPHYSRGRHPFIGDCYLSNVAGILACHFAFWITSLEYTSVASSVVLVTTTPLWVVLFSPILLKEKITKGIYLGLGMAFAGSVIVVLSDICSFPFSFLWIAVEHFLGGKAILGNLFALAGALFAAGYLMIGRKVREHLSLLAYVFLVYLISAIFLLLFTGFTSTSLYVYNPFNWIWLIALAVIPQLIGHSLFNWALRFLSTAYVSIALLGEPVGTVILAYLVLKDKPTLFEVIGGILILCGIYLASRVEKRVSPLAV